MPSASSTSSTRRRIAAGVNAEVLEHERDVVLDVVDDELRLGVLGDEPDDVGELARVVRARRPAEHDDVAARTARRWSGERARSRRAAACSCPSPTCRRTSSSSPGSTSRSTPVSAACRRVGIRERHVADRDRAHDVTRVCERTPVRATAAA